MNEKKIRYYFFSKKENEKLFQLLCHIQQKNSYIIKVTSISSLNIS